MAGQYDRALRCLERRLAANDVRQTGGMRGRIRSAVETLLTLGPEADLTNHLTLLELSRGPDNMPRALTTNFDPGFERAWLAARGRRLASHAGPAMPQPGTTAFEGALHLHGRIADPTLELEPTELVLTSAEFGEAYLRSGWASRYIYDLTRAYTLILVGYQADDPPMRYLLEVLEADRLRFPDLRKVYAFAPAAPGQEELERALWLAKGIEAIVYPIVEPANHCELYRTLRAWRDYALSPSSWRERRLRTILAEPFRQGREAEASEAAALLSGSDAPNILSRSPPDASWWPILSGDDRLSSRADVLEAWIVGRAEEPDMLRACVANQPGPPSVYDRVLWRARHGEPAVGPEIARGWQLLASASRQSHHGSYAQGWYEAVERIRAGTIDHGVRVAVVDAILPRLKIARPFVWPSQTTAGEPYSLSSIMRVDFEAEGQPSASEVLQAFSNDPAETLGMLRIADRALEGALEEAADAGHLDGLDHASQNVRSFSILAPPGLEIGFASLTLVVAGFWARLATTDVPAARSVASAWAASSFALRKRLHLHALSRKGVFTGEVVGTTLSGLTDRDFWMGECDQEVAGLLAARWSDLGNEPRGRLEERMSLGIPESLFRRGTGTDDEDADRAVRDWLIFRRIEPIRRAGGVLSPHTSGLLAEIVERSPEGTLTLPDADDPNPRGIFIGSRGDPEQFRTVPEDALVEAALKAAERDPFGQGEVWQLLCESDPMRAIRAIRAASLAGPRLTAAVVALLSTASDIDSAEFHDGVSRLLIAIPSSEIGTSLAANAAQWIWRRADKAGAGVIMPAEMLAVWDRIATTLLDADNAPEDHGVEATLDGAINSPSGLLARALQAWIGRSKWPVDQGFGPDMGTRLDRLATASGPAGRNARLILVRDLAFLHYVDPDWTMRTLVPRLSWTDPEASSLWLASAGSQIGRAALFNALKPAFLEACLRAGSHRQRSDALATELIQVARWKLDPKAAGYDLTWMEARSTLSRAPVAMRQSASMVLLRLAANDKDSIADRAQRWRECVGPLVERIWPLDAAARDERSSSNLALMTLECAEAFPEAVDAIIDFVVPFELVRIYDWPSPSGSHRTTVFRHARAFLRLLDRALGPHPARLPTDISSTMNRLVSENPGLEGEPAYQRLEALRRRM